jgi:serine/threonine protein kinase
MQINAQKKDPAHLPEFSDSWNDLLLLMLNKDPLKRITAAEILAHPWFE